MKLRYPRFACRSAFVVYFIMSLSHTGSLHGSELIGYEAFITGNNPGEYSQGRITGQAPSVPGWTGPWGHQGGNEDLNAADVSLAYSSAGVELLTSGGKAVATHARVGRLLDQTYDSDSEGVIYLSFLMRLHSTGGVAFTPFELHDGGLDDAHRTLFLGLANVGPAGMFPEATFGLRVAENQGEFTQELGPADTAVNLFVLRMDFNRGNDSVTVWRNPESLGGTESSDAIATLSGFNLGFDRTTLTAFIVGVDYDEIRIGATWADVTPVSEESLVPPGQTGTLIELSETGDTCASNSATRS